MENKHNISDEHKNDENSQMINEAKDVQDKYVWPGNDETRSLIVGSKDHGDNNSDSSNDVDENKEKYSKTENYPSHLCQSPILRISLIRSNISKKYN